MEHLTIPLKLATVFLTVAVFTWAYQRRRELSKRRMWIPVGRLSHIYIYPVKSGKGRELSEAECTPLGLKYTVEGKKPALRDRVFVVFDVGTKNFVSGKLNPKMLSVSVEPMTENSVLFSHPDKEDIQVILPNQFDENLVTLWSNEKVRTVDCGDEVAKWISEAVKGKPEGLRVGFWPETENKWRRDVESLRPLDVSVFKNLSNKYTGAYSDTSSYLLVSESSLQELNERIGEADQCRITNFRPNLVIEGSEPFAEDKWDWVKVGDAVFRNFRPCTRCSYTTINPETGEKNKAGEPIKTLKTYRTMKQLGEPRVDAAYPVFGVYIGLHTPANIRSGDTVFVSY